MNSNPNRKEKPMIATTKATSVAVLVALGLTLTARAAEPPKPEAPGEVYVADLPWTSSTPGVRKNMMPSWPPGPKDIPITIGKVTYAKGIGTMTDQPTQSLVFLNKRAGIESSVVVDIAGKGYRSFHADVGAVSGYGTAFLVLVDGIVKARTRPIENVPVKLAADVTNGRTLTLTAISYGKQAWANWGDARVSTAPLPASSPTSGMGPAERSWDLKTGSTHLTVGRQGDRIGIYSLKHAGSAHNWMEAPSEIPLMAKVEANRVAHALKWVFQDAVVDDRQGTKVTLRFVNAAPQLTLESEWWARPGPGPVRTAMTIRNDSKEPVKIFHQPSLRLRATGDDRTASWCIRVSGHGPDPVGLYRDPLAANEFRYLKCGGNDWIGFLGLDVGDTQGLYVGVEWSAGWIYREDVSATTTLVEADGFLNGDQFSFALPAGETFVVPPASIGAYRGDLDDAGNDLKKYLWNYGIPEILRTDETYPKVQWNGFTATGTAKDSWKTLQSRWNPWIDAIAPLGFEEAMHDVGWWGDKDKTGAPCPVRWPQGLKVTGDYTRAKGLRFGLYYPRFHYPVIKRLFEDYGADIWRNDGPLGYGGGLLDYQSIKNGYDMLDRLQKELPAFQWEICGGGGTIKDFGAMKRAVKIFNVEASYGTINQEQVFWDSSYLFPPIQLEGSNGGRVGSGLTGLVYTFRSAAQGAPEWFLDTPDGGWRDKAWTQEEKDAIRTVVAMYKAKVRPLQRNSNLYHLTARPDGKIWYAFQYYKPEQKKGVVYVLKPRSPVESQVIKLKGLDPTATYALTFADGSNPPMTRTGAELMNAGIQITLKGQVVSEWIFLN